MIKPHSVFGFKPKYSLRLREMQILFTGFGCSSNMRPLFALQNLLYCLPRDSEDARKIPLAEYPGSVKLSQLPNFTFRQFAVVKLLPSAQCPMALPIGPI